MKLDVAAALLESVRRPRARVAISWVSAVFMVLTVLVFFWSGAAMALDGIDLSKPSEEIVEEGCSRLVQIKYPFLSCGNGEMGPTDSDETWENIRQIPLMSSWVESDGFWGPSLNETN